MSSKTACRAGLRGYNRGPVPVANVPMIDLRRQYETVRGDVDAAIRGLLESQQWILGRPVEDLERALAALAGVPHGVGCASGSDALYLALRAVGVGPGDEVVTSPFSFFATAGAVWRLGAKPVFADIDARTFNLDPGRAAAAITPRTRAILPVHLYGRVADVDAIGAAAARAGDIAVVEDAAQAIGAETVSRRKAGGLGVAAAFSFFPTKNLGGYGDGGLVTTGDAEVAARLRRLRVHGERERYRHVEVGVNARLDAVQAAVLLAKLPRLAGWNERRRALAARYGRLLAGTPLVLPEVADGHIFHQYTVRVPGGARDRLREHLAAAGVATAVYYPVPLHLQECFRYLGWRPGDLPEAERAAAECLSLPIFPEMRDDEQEAVAEAIGRFRA